MSDNVFSKCGMRCDLCLLYRPNVERDDRRAEICQVFSKVWPGFAPDPKTIICDGCGTDRENPVLFTPDCQARRCVLEKRLEHCGHCSSYPCPIFPAEPSHEELVQKIDVEHQWTWADEKLMEAYFCKKNMDAFRSETLGKISHETMRFMRGKYTLDEIGDGKNELKFKQGKKTILTVYIHEDRFTFLVIFGKTERELFENQRSVFSGWIQEHYDNAKTYHDGKWMFLDVTTMEQLEEIKKLVQIKKKPNRKSFPREGALYSQCGQRCDLCIHYTGMTEEQRAVAEPNLVKMWGGTDWSMRCSGCYSDTCYCRDDLCNAKKCALGKGVAECKDCTDFPCIKATSADFRSMIHTEVHYAGEITCGILPYVPWQYED